MSLFRKEEDLGITHKAPIIEEKSPGKTVDSVEEIMEIFPQAKPASKKTNLKKLSEDELQETNKKAGQTTLQEQAILQLKKMANSMMFIAFTVFCLALGACCFFAGKGEYFISLVTGSFLPFLGRILQVIIKAEGKDPTFWDAIKRSLKGD